MKDEDKQLILAGKKIGFFGKGGSGKSTCVVLIGRALADAGYSVCIIDADSTNIGLHRALGIDRQPAPLIEYYGGMVFSGGRVTCPVDDPTPLEGADVDLKTLNTRYYAHPAPNVYLLTAGKLGASGAGAGCDGPISKIARDINIRLGAQPVVTLVDFKAGFEDTARGVVTRLDWAIVVVDPTQASITMAGHMKDMVQNIRGGQMPATQHLERADLVGVANQLFRESPLQKALFVLNKIGDDKIEPYLDGQLAEHGIKPIGTIHDDPAIGDAWLRGTAITSTNIDKDVDGIIRAMENLAMESLVAAANKPG